MKSTNYKKMGQGRNQKHKGIKTREWGTEAESKENWEADSA